MNRCNNSNKPRGTNKQNLRQQSSKISCYPALIYKLLTSTYLDSYLPIPGDRFPFPGEKALFYGKPSFIQGDGRADMNGKAV